MGILLNDNTIIYNIGDVVDLLLQVNDLDIGILSDNITINITDPFGNLIDTITAELIQDSVYSAEYVIPLSLKDRYNINDEDESLYDNVYYYLTDTWVLNDTASLDFQLLVHRTSTELPTKDNVKITISLEDILDTNGNVLSAETIEFTTKLTPFYGNTESVKSFYKNDLNDVDIFDLALDIIEWSNYVDLHMKPDVINRQAAYNNAVREYVNASVAKYLLIPILNVNSETKQLDTFQVSKSSGGAEFVINKLDDIITKYANIIYAGGLDTPFISRTFVKGLADPNRPNVARSKLLINDTYPWVNTTTSSSVVEIDGNDIEIRGIRGVSFRSIFRVPSDSLVHMVEVAF